MPDRLDLQTLLEETLGSSNVYFQPPPTVKLLYPCIIYEHSRSRTRFANNNPYNYKKIYKLTVVDKNPDSLIVDKVAMLQGCVFDRRFTLDNLNHNIFSISY